MSRDSHDEIVANRVRQYMRNYFGFYPTNNPDSAHYFEENRMFIKLVKNLVTEITNRNILAKNIRHKLENFNYMVREQSKFLSEHARNNSALQSLFTSYDSVETYVNAVSFAIVGQYQLYTAQKEEEKKQNKD